MTDPVAALLSMYRAAVSAASTFPDLEVHVPRDVRGRVFVFAAGKAAGAMAAAVEPTLLALYGAGRISGFVVVQDLTPDPGLARLELVRSAHPRPDERSLAAAARALECAGRLGPDDLLLALISGGGSALVAAPSVGLSFADKVQALDRLLNSGAPIEVLNAARKRLSAVKGGRLALAAAPARVLTLVASDVPGDDPRLVASGPTCPGAPATAETEAALARFAATLAEPVRARLLRPDPELQSGDARFASVETRLVRSPADALSAASAAARARGFTVIDLGQAVGTSVDLAAAHAALVRRRVASASGGPVVLLSGGETTASAGPAGGRGGRNTAYLLALGLALEGIRPVHALAADTDGIDGSGPHAGAVLRPETLAEARARGVDPARALALGDSYAVFDASGDGVVTGPTGGNLNDLRLVGPL